MGPTSVNHAANTFGIVQNHFKKINKSDVDPDFIHIEENGIEEDTADNNANQPSPDVDSDTSFENGVDSRDTYQQFKWLLICDFLDEVDVCTLKLMELLYLVKLDKG